MAIGALGSLMQVLIKFDETTEEGRYFLACARIRNISATGLARHLILTISQDKLVAGVLDDEDDIKARQKGEHTYCHTEVNLKRIENEGLADPLAADLWTCTGTRQTSRRPY
jgi:hypothetical protein